MQIKLEVMGQGLSAQDHAHLWEALEGAQAIEDVERPLETEPDLLEVAKDIAVLVCSVTCTLAKMPAALEALKAAARAADKSGKLLWITFRARMLSLEEDVPVKELVAKIDAILKATGNPAERLQEWRRKCAEDRNRTFGSLGEHQTQI